ncbi:hypothetical protein [Rhodococcus qingshengii]|uniref:hypothetical protein n=2 Tax=Rhodococcus TaxID=1827 RepID=UPI002235F2E9|nr:hypothetical protein [Rhodococcus qingshengii]
MRRKIATCVAAAGLMAAVSGCAAVAQGGPWTGMETSAPAPVVVAEVAGESTPRLDELLGSVTVVDKLPNIPGYERGCGTGESCVFGTAWTDKYDGPLARNGCDTRIICTQF